MNKPRRMSAFALACCAGLVLGLAACGESASVPSGSPASSPASAPVSPPPGGRACGTTSRPPGRIRHVVWIVMENKSYDEVIGSSRAPYINRLAAECGLATNFQAEAHPSLPNYVAMTSGSTQGITDDADPGAHRLGAPSIFSLLGARWRSLEDSMPANCAGADAELYAVRHNPATYYTGVADSCRARDVPLGAAPDLSAAFTYITPNLCHDMHPCPSTPDSGAQTAAGDSWLAGFVPQLLASREYRSGTTAVFLTWDEGEGDSQRIATLVLSPSTPAGARSSRPLNHYSMLRTTQDLLALRPYLGQAASATSMAPDFRLAP